MKRSLLNRILFFWTTTNHDSATHWYYWGPLQTRKFGNLKVHAVAALVYACVALMPVISFALADGWDKGWFDLVLPDFAHTKPADLQGWNLFCFLLWAVFITVSLPLFQWIEANHFEEWLIDEKTKPAARQTEWFDTNAKHVETFWKAVGGLFLGLGLLATLNDRTSPSTASQKDSLSAFMVKQAGELAKAIKGAEQVSKALSRSAEALNAAAANKKAEELQAIRDNTQATNAMLTKLNALVEELQRLHAKAQDGK